MRPLLTLIAFVPLLLLAASYLGMLHPLGDSLAVFRAVLVVVSMLSLLLLLALRRWWGLLTGAVLLASAAFTVTRSAQVTAMTGQPYALYQKNLWFRLPDRSALLADIRQSRPDFITLQEVHRRNQPILSALKQSYSAQHFCDLNAIGGEAVLSRWPVVAGSKRCFEKRGMAMMQVTTPDGPVWLISLHLHWPWPHGQAAQVTQLVQELEKLDGEVILGGDFNMAPWSHTMRRITAATRSAWLRPAHNTFELFQGRLGIPIDHVLISSGAGGVERRPKLGSDHHGLLARFELR